MSKLRGGLIQMGLKTSTDQNPDIIRQAMVDAHLPLIDQAGEQGVQVLSFQEVFTQPYFCPSQDNKWYEAAESIPDGPTVTLMQGYAAKYKMVIVVPIYEKDAVNGVYYNTAAVIDADGSYLGKYRKTHIPQVAGLSVGGAEANQKGLIQSIPAMVQRRSVMILPPKGFADNYR